MSFLVVFFAVFFFLTLGRGADPRGGGPSGLVERQPQASAPRVIGQTSLDGWVDD
jgi:hypothetical protein